MEEQFAKHLVWLTDLRREVRAQKAVLHNANQGTRDPDRSGYRHLAELESDTAEEIVRFNEWLAGHKKTVAKLLLDDAVLDIRTAVDACRRCGYSNAVDPKLEWASDEVPDDPWDISGSEDEAQPVVAGEPMEVCDLSTFDRSGMASTTGKPGAGEVGDTVDCSTPDYSLPKASTSSSCCGVCCCDGWGCQSPATYAGRAQSLYDEHAAGPKSALMLACAAAALRKGCDPGLFNDMPELLNALSLTCGDDPSSVAGSNARAVWDFSSSPARIAGWEFRW